MDVCTGAIPDEIKALKLTIGGHKSVNRYSVNNEANFFLKSLIR